MMRSLVFLLIFGNIVLFALSAGWIDVGGEAAVVPTESHQPLSPDRIRIVSRGEPPRLAQPASASCLEWRALSAAQADAVEALAASQKNLALIREETQPASASYRVFIPVAKGGQAAAEKKAAELKKFGIKDFRLDPESGDDAWAISLGVYDNAAKAEQGLASFRKQGARSAQLQRHVDSPAVYRVRLSGLPEALAALRNSTDGGAPQACPTDAAASPASAARDATAVASTGGAPAPAAHDAPATGAGSASAAAKP